MVENRDSQSDRSSNYLAIFAGGIGFLTVGLGAFAAHMLDGTFSESAADWRNTATLYGLSHAVAAFSCALGPSRFRRAGWAFALGAFLFGASLHALALGAPRIVGAITPLGGLSLLAG
ncbi:MAG: DUF423 domain-containing protein [Pseudomonadota bacterium]